ETTSPLVVPRRPQSAFTLTGQWKCSCGDTWHLVQEGKQVRGVEVGDTIHQMSVTGTFDGKTFEFICKCRCGRDDQDGRGAMKLSDDGKTLHATIVLLKGNEVLQPTLTRITK
ncbi:MAG: hypothetical protein KDA75_20645, partial [Planctomycetaceae bacterium]|nr:hypothetical protein [Planctomycetaceae bacterium]